jgi:hypothetical protein
VSRVRPSPWLSLAWEPSQDGRLHLTLRAPPKRGAHRLAVDELWVVALLDHLGATAGAWTFAEIVEIARRHADANADIETQLEKLWPLAFIDAAAAEWHPDAMLWEQRGWKFALQYMLASSDESSRQTGATSLDHPEIDVQAALHRRRTCREFAGTPLDLGTLETLLSRATDGSPLPSRLAIHLVVMRVIGLESGIYRYLPDTHAITPVHHEHTEQLEAQLVRTLIGQPYVVGTAVAVLMSGNPIESSLRAWLIEIGMLAQRLLLAGHAFELDSFLSAAILEHEARALTAGDIDASMSPIHLVAFGGR